MDNKAKSGKEVIEEFFNEIESTEGTDTKTVSKLISLYQEKKLTETNIQNALDDLLKEEIKAEYGINGEG